MQDLITLKRSAYDAEPARRKVGCIIFRYIHSVEHVRIDLVSAFSQRLRPFPLLFPYHSPPSCPPPPSSTNSYHFPCAAEAVISGQQMAEEEGIAALRTPSSLLPLGIGFSVITSIPSSGWISYISLCNDAFIPRSCLKTLTFCVLLECVVDRGG